MTLRTRDGDEVFGATPEDQARELHKMSRAPCASDYDFRREMASRAVMQTGRDVRFDTAAHFIADLVAVGVLIEE
jgi:hypothetical protein